MCKDYQELKQKKFEIPENYSVSLAGKGRDCLNCKNYTTIGGSGYWCPLKTVFINCNR
jgi:pyruvate-formate lyase-activating enzyme